MQTALLYFSFAGLAATLPVLLGIWLWRMDSRPVLEALSRLSRLPVVVRFVLVAFVAQLIVYGSTKTNGNGYVEGGVTNGNGYGEGGVTNGPSALPPPLMMLAGEMPTVFGFTSNQLAAGFVLSHVGFGEPRGFEKPPSASVVEDWRLRGAADDWRPGPPSSLIAGTSAVFADGRVQDRVRNPSRVYAPLHAPLGVVPEANWGLVAGTNAQSRVWHMTTASNSVVVTWEDVLLGRDTNSPASVQAEFFENGNFAYRYDLSRAAAALSDPAVASNVVVGAWRGGEGESLDPAACASNFPSIASVFFHALSGEDALVADRDGDGVSTYDEIFVHRTDPGLSDSDGDGICDGDEIVQSLDPLAVSVSNEALLARIEGFQTNVQYAAAYVAVTNELVGYRLWDSFAATWPAGATNLVYERTVRIDSHGGWQHYYLSSRPDAAGGWSLGGLELEWEDSCGESGTATASPVADSLYLPLSTNGPSFVTFRLRATAPDLRSVNPVYLVGYAPAVSIKGGMKVSTSGGDDLTVFTEGSQSSIGVSIDRSRRPCRAPLSQRELAMDGLADLEARTDGELRYDGDAYGGAIVASRAGVYRLPDVPVSGADQTPVLRGPRRGGGGHYLVILMPWVKYGDDHCIDGGLGWDEDRGYFVEYEYPLDSGCLVREWRRRDGGDWICNCIPEAGCGLGDGNGFATVDVEVDGETATATVIVGGEAVWSDSAVHVRGGRVCWDGLAMDECDDCEGDCSRGDCSSLEGPSLGSFRFRIPAGMPRKGQVAGFAYVVSDGPVSVTPASFRYLLRDDVGATVTTNGSARTVSCTCERGRTLQIEAMQNGTRIVVRKQATGTLEHTWEIVNVGGSQSEIRVRQISRLDNVMQDWTYECMENAETGGWNWRATDNIAGIREELERSDTLNADGLVSELRTKYDAEGNWLGEVETVSQVVGERECSVLREVCRREETGFNTVVRTADYWRDTEHPARNGKLRLLLADDLPWEYHEWNKDGFETMRVEQRNGSAAPVEFPVAASNGFANASALADAFLTTFSYEPLDGDDTHPDDCGKVRCESRYVVQGGVATLIGRTWRRYTHVTACGYPAVREETWRASSAGASPGDAGNAHSWRTVFDTLAVGVPLVLRGETAEEMDEDGIRTAAEVSVSGGRVALASRKWRGETQFPAYEVVERDGTYGLVLRTAKCLSGGGAVVDETVSVYDDQSRLRSASHLDGTSETNAYSCCRLLWKRDREGKKVLRSAQTGTDHLYYAMEEVWLGEVEKGKCKMENEGESVTNGFRVTKHYFDALGRETNTVVGIGYTPGEAASPASTLHSTLYTLHSSYPYGGSDYAVGTDARGKVEVRSTVHYGDRDEQLTDTYADRDAQEPAMRVVRTEVRNGGSATRREWDGKWTERRTWSDYDAAGCRIDFEATFSSDCGTVTNSVARHDFLGRQVCAETPQRTTATIYDGATGCALSSTWTAGSVSRTSENVYDGLGRLVGSTLDGVTSRRDETYEEMSNAWWKVMRSAVFSGSETNSVVETRERLTGLSDALRAQTVRVSADGVATETASSYDPATGLVTETVVSSVAGETVRTSRHGVLISVEAPDGTTAYDYDPLGRRVRETCGARVSEVVYSAAGDVVLRRTRTGAEAFAEESFAYDSSGNCIAETNALGCVTTTAYDAEGNVVEVSGAAYPVRYAYDTEGRRTLLSTTRDGTIWDVTTWEYDPGTGRCTAKRYADGSQSATSYTPDGLESVVTRPSLQWKENVYDERRRLVGEVSNDGSENAAFGYDDFGRATSASNAAASYAYVLHRGGIATNETVVVGTNGFAIARSIDAFGRIDGRGVAGGSFQSISYTSENRVGAVSDPSSATTYAYGADGSDAGYTLSLSGGAAVTRQVGRDIYRPELVTCVTNIVNGVAVSWYDYVHDAAGRVASRNSDAFSYNDRGEVVGATFGGQSDSYAYDQIGNFTDAVFGGTTNTYAANELNQYTSILCVSAPLREISHDADGNMASDGAFGYAYDSAGRLASVSTGGVAVAEFEYDALGRRVRKTTPEAVHTYVYDGWNLVLERIERDGGEADTVEYFWGKDLSGSLGGAGGIGGLLYLRHNGAAYVPLYDANGNAVQYVDAAGAVVASYVYDAFGRTLASSGPQAELFRFRFSTKYHDPESGLVYYGYRFYSPDLARWLSRDPLEEDGGLNLYGFCGNAAIDRFDPHGLSEGQLKEFAEEFAVKLFWVNVAEEFFRKRKKWPISADMLLMAVYGNVGPGRHAFPEDGQLAKAIKSSSEYKSVIDNLANKQKVGTKFYKENKKPINFNTEDLKTAVGHAVYNLEGDICKLKNGRARLDLRITVLDTYDFHMWGDAEIEANGAFLSFGNNLAYLSQQKGYLKTYPWSVSFEENRGWPWR